MRTLPPDHFRNGREQAGNWGCGCWCIHSRASQFYPPARAFVGRSRRDGSIALQLQLAQRAGQALVVHRRYPALDLALRLRAKDASFYAAT